jgi:ribose 5-phosphate isomerase B
MISMQTSIIYLASDHAGCVLRGLVCVHLEEKGYRVIDLGPGSGESADYPDFGVKLAVALRDDDRACGIAVCGSGIGISIAVNRFPWVRAALVSSPEAAGLSRQHNDANVLALGERLITPALALTCVDKFLSTEFEGGRHQVRVDKLSVIETESRNI